MEILRGLMIIHLLMELNSQRRQLVLLANSINNIGILYYSYRSLIIGNIYIYIYNYNNYNYNNINK